MKIAINAIRVSRQGGGGTDHYITHLVKYLAMEGYAFDVFTLAPEHFPNIPSERVKVPFPFNLAVISSGTAFDESPFPNSVPQPRKPVRQWAALLLGDFVKMFWTQFVFPVRLVLGRYDLVFSPSQIDALPFPPVKQVMAVLDVIPFVLKLPLVKHGFYLKNFFPIALKNSAQVIAISENTKKDVVKLFNAPESKITSILLARPEFGDPRTFSKSDIEELKRKYALSHYILCVSGNHAHKNLPRLIRAFQKISLQTDCKLVIAGYQDAARQAELGQMADEKGLKDRVMFLGHMPSSDLPPLYGGAEIFVFPSLYEGFGLPPLEALSYGVPVAVSNRSSLPEVVGDAGVYFDPESVQEMADQMMVLLKDQDLRLQLREKGLEQAKKFSWQMTARATWQVFENAVRN